VTHEIPPLNTQDQRLLLEMALGDLAATMNGSIDTVVAQFQLNPTSISGLKAEVVGKLNVSGRPSKPEDAAQFEKILWEACRAQARPRMGELAQSIRAVAEWDDLVLPDSQKSVLAEIAIQVRQRARVYEEWGFAARSNRGLGISALFAGPSGTGKTMAAEVLANNLNLDLYRIDLSQVVSKYIGETEKNLRRVFDAAEAGGAILLFDEADALFGKRSEVKDSHDRYANIEVSYLLQRMEEYRGLAILTSNMKGALDQAFMRRIRFMVNFPFPSEAQRQTIWENIYPPETPSQGLEFEKLARLNITGGNIRNIALYAAFLAAEAGTPVRMDHILRAARVEYSKLEKTLTASEIRDWQTVNDGH
jgi:SpoVK/Ycf46/Vps4 family AAA+-type ATPase